MPCTKLPTSPVCARPGCRRSEAPLLRRFTPAVAAGAQAARLLRNTRSRHSTIDAAPPIHSQKCANAPPLRRADRGPRTDEHRHPRPALPGRAATDDRHIAGRRIGETALGGDSQARRPLRSPAERAAIETTPIVPATSIGSTPGHRTRRRGGPVRHVCAFWFVSSDPSPRAALALSKPDN